MLTGEESNHPCYSDDRSEWWGVPTESLDTELAGCCISTKRCDTVHRALTIPTTATWLAEKCEGKAQVFTLISTFSGTSRKC